MWLKSRVAQLAANSARGCVLSRRAASVMHAGFPDVGLAMQSTSAAAGPRLGRALQRQEEPRLVYY